MRGVADLAGVFIERAADGPANALQEGFGVAAGDIEEQAGTRGVFLYEFNRRRALGVEVSGRAWPGAGAGLGVSPDEGSETVNDDTALSKYKGLGPRFGTLLCSVMLMPLKFEFRYSVVEAVPVILTDEMRSFQAVPTQVLSAVGRRRPSDSPSQSRFTKEIGHGACATVADAIS